MTKNDLDTAIEMCERIMEFDTRTLKDRESENGYIFDKVYELLKFLRQFQFDTNAKGGSTDTISRQAVITEFSCCDLTPDGGIDANYAIDFLKQMPSAQSEPKSYRMGYQAGYAAAQRWIPCNVALPKENGQYIVTVKYEHVDGYEDIYSEHGEWYDGHWDAGFGHCGRVEKVLAWMPLPEPYREEI